MSIKKLNILFISGWYPNRVNPTLGNFVQKHAEAVATKCTVATLNVCSDKNNKNTFETTIHTVNEVYTVNVYFKKTNNPFIKVIRYLKAHKIGINIIQNELKTIDLVHQNILFPSGYIALKLKKKYKIPYIITEHWTGYLPSKKHTFGLFELYISKKIARNANVITTVSADLKKAMQNLGFLNSYKIVYNVVDTHLFSVPPNKSKKEKKTFLHVSHLDDAHKNISGMLRVAKQLATTRNDFEFYFVGDGDTKIHENYAKELMILNSFVFFDGTKTTQEIAELMKKADCFILFSNYENLPVVIIEAMACGLPVISSNVGGIAEHVSEKFGKLVRAKDENELLISTHQMINDLNNNRYNSLEISNYAKEKFSYEKVCSSFHEIYVETLKNV